MANIMNPSSMFADSLAEFSRSAHKAFAELESQSRLDVTRALAETRSALSERDKALEDLHKGMLEVQSWKQENAASKSALMQAELTISHQADTIASSAETIAQLKRELTQWKDQARNWQEHFLRVEQERCAISSKLEEVMSERIEHALASTSLFTATPAKGRYSQAAKSAPSTTSKPPRGTSSNPQSSDSKSHTRPHLEDNLSSPHQQKSHKSSRAAHTSTYSEMTSHNVDADHLPRETTRPQTGEKNLKKTNGTLGSKPKQQHPQTQPTASSSAPNVRSSTVIRRVHAVINVKREESEDEQAEFSGRSSSQLKEESASRISTLAPAPRHDERLSHPRRRKQDASVSPQEYEDEGEEEEEAPRKRGRLRQRSQINYQESDYEEEDEDEDELMMGAEDNHEEVYGMHQVQKRPHPTKKRKMNGR